MRNNKQIAANSKSRNKFFKFRSNDTWLQVQKSLGKAERLVSGW